MVKKLHNLFVGFLLFACLKTSVFAQVNVPSYQLALQEKFKAGINISFFENYWKPEEYLVNNYRKVMDKI
jgi:hypothetical protein